MTPAPSHGATSPAGVSRGATPLLERDDLARARARGALRRDRRDYARAVEAAEEGYRAAGVAATAEEVAAVVAGELDRLGPPPDTATPWTPPAEPAVPTLVRADAGRARAVVRSLATVQPEAVRYVWAPYLPRRRLSLLVGDPGAGKTTVALRIAAALSRAGTLPGPDGLLAPTLLEPATTVYLTAEDGLADCIRPRFDAAGGDPARVIAVEGVEEPRDDGRGARIRPVSLRDVGILDAVLREHRPALLVVDPVQGFLGAGTDMHRANDVREVLAGVARLADAHDCCALVIGHMSKATQARALYRALGSIDFVAAARSVLLAGRDPQTTDRHALAHGKCSYAAPGVTLAYDLDPARPFWAGVRSDLDAEALVAAIGRDGEADGALAEAVEWLREALTSGLRLADEIAAEARRHGHAERTLRRARSTLGVVARREAEIGGGRGAGRWWWALPEGGGP